VQLKVLQTLPSLFQHYADDLNGDLLGSTLEICAALQNTKTAAVSNTAAATLQQLVVSVFEKVSSAGGSCTNLISFECADFLQQSRLISCQQ
jgi:hypothetical protein